MFKHRGKRDKCLRVPSRRIGIDLGRALLMLSCPSSHLLDQTRSWNQHIPHLAIQPMGNASQGLQCDGALCLCRFELPHSLSAYSDTTTQRT